MNTSNAKISKIRLFSFTDDKIREEKYNANMINIRIGGVLVCVISSIPAIRGRNLIRWLLSSKSTSRLLLITFSSTIEFEFLSYIVTDA